MRNRALRCLEWLVCAGALVGGAWLALRFVLPGLAPFLLAYLFAALMEPLVRLLRRLHISRAAASAVVTLGLLALLLFLMARLLTRGFAALNALAAELPGLLSAWEQRLSALEQWLLGLAAEIPGGADYLELALDAVGRALTAVPAGLGSFFLSASFPKVKAFLLAQLPAEWLRHFELVSQDLKQSFGGWLRAQLLLMLITFAQLLAALLILRVRGAMLIAALTAIVDALPVFGVGVVLLPWAAVALLRGEMRLGIGLAISFAGISLMRELLQAKLLGDQIGMDPLSSLLAVYVGWKLCGVPGLLLFPLLLVTLRQLNDRGLLRLWKRP